MSNLNPELFKAILAMDSYNRGYDASIQLTGSQVGNASIKTDSQILGTTVVDGQTVDRHETIGFYALAYDYDGETVISYRGTDYPEDDTFPARDIEHGWTLGGGMTSRKRDAINSLCPRKLKRGETGLHFSHRQDARRAKRTGIFARVSA